MVSDERGFSVWVVHFILTVLEVVHDLHHLRSLVQTCVVDSSVSFIAFSGIFPQLIR